MNRVSSIATGLVMMVVLCGAQDECANSNQPPSIAREKQMQEAVMAESVAQVGIPAIKNFREKKLLKDIFELRDQDGLVTYTYFYNQMTGKLVFFCDSIGYGIPYATEFTNPQQTVSPGGAHEYVAIAQADPNGLYSPPSADGTWVMCKNPNGKDVLPVYVEPRVVVAPFKMQ